MVVRKVVLALLLVLIVGVPSADAVTRERKIGATLVLDTQLYTETIPQGGPGGTPIDVQRCNYAVFVQFPNVAGAVSYNVVVQDKDPRVNTTRDLSGPPFNDDVEGYKAPSGQHRFGGLTGGGGPAPCPTMGDFNGRFEIKKAVAIFDDKLRIAGSVTRADGTPVPNVRVSASGPGRASASTDAQGAYAMLLPKKGTYRVQAAGASYCVSGPRECERTKTVEVTSGTKTVDFEQRSQFVIQGTIRDEFRRGLGGIRVGASGPDTDSTTTDAGGRYKLRVGRAGTYELSARPGGRPGGPYELFYVVRSGAPSTGQAADVTLTDRVEEATVDFELDRRLQFDVQAPSLVADGFSRGVVSVTARTQRGDPAPSVPLDIDPSVGAHPRAVICTTGGGSSVLWPSLLGDGSVSPSGLPRGPATTTNAAGQVLFRVFPGIEPGTLTITGARQSDATNVFTGSVPFARGSARAVSREELSRALQQTSPTGRTFFGTQDVIFELLAERQGEADLLSGITAAPVVAGPKHGVLFFSQTAPPQQLPGGGIVPSDSVFVLDNSFVNRVTAQPGLASLREWAAGQAVSVERTDRRTFLDWPVPTAADGGLGTCLSGTADGAVTYAAHSPVRLLLVDARGRKLGFDARGRRYADAPGAAFKRGGTSYIVAPRGTARLEVSGTGTGPVTLEARRGAKLSVARFTARKGRRGTLRVDGALPRAFTFGGRRVTSVAGMPLTVRGLPKRLAKRGGTTLRLRVADALGRAVPGASATAGRTRAAGDAKGRITLVVPQPSAKRVTITVTAPGTLRVRRTVLVR